MIGSWVAMLAAGGAAGLGVAMPLGPIGVLLLREGTSGWRRGLSAACAVACVDMGFAAGAVLAGEMVNALLAGHQRWIRWVAAIILAAVAIRGLWTAGRATESAAPDMPTSRVFFRFIGLTAINPTTMLYFVALAASLRAEIGGGPLLGLFVAGVFLASLAWQIVLVGIGATVGGRLGAVARRGTHIAGNGLVLTYAVILAYSA